MIIAALVLFLAVWLFLVIRIGLAAVVLVLPVATASVSPPGLVDGFQCPERRLGRLVFLEVRIGLVWSRKSIRAAAASSASCRIRSSSSICTPIATAGFWRPVLWVIA